MEMLLKSLLLLLLLLLLYRSFVSCKYTKEEKMGIATKFHISCHLCHTINIVNTSQKHKSGSHGPAAYMTITLEQY